MSEHLYFYHIINSDINIKRTGLVSLEYMYKHKMYDEFLKNTDKYRDRLCNGWNIYPGRKPESLTVDEIYNGLKIFRGKDGNNRIYFFRYPIYNKLSKDIRDILRVKKIYRIDINDPKTKKYIDAIYWGNEGSHGDNKELSRSYYENISVDDYFDNFNPNVYPLFSTLNHISISPKNGILPYHILEEVDTPNERKEVYTMESTDLLMPNETNAKEDIQEILDRTNPKDIFLTSDWHIFQNRYKKEKNPVNTQDIITWCRQNIKPNQVFMYLGDISFRWVNKKDRKESAKIMASIPGIKVLILGNHDLMVGDEYYTSCGFDYVYERIEWHNIVFTHRPISMELYPDDYLNIHGHMHKWREYNTCDGSKNVNVYPSYYDNKPITLDYVLKHKDKLMEGNKRSNWTNIGESAITPLNEAMNATRRPVVLYAANITSYNIASLVYQFKDRLITGNKDSKIAIKIHVGEEGNNNYLKPYLSKDLIEMTNGTYVDSNVAYDSIRKTTEGHFKVAAEHGFTNIDILDADGDIVISVPHQNKIEKANKEYDKESAHLGAFSKGDHLSELNVGAHLANYDAMIVFTHFKGHAMAGYGGSVKNIGMGIPSGKVGKVQVHGKEFKREPIFLERLVESAAAIEDYFDGHIVYVNVLKNISVDCDCDGGEHIKPAMDDIGVLVSDDLYAIEQASIDLIRNMPDNKKIIERISTCGGLHQLEYMDLLGMNHGPYKLINIDGRSIKLENTVIDESKRSELPDSSFGIPEDRKYPLDSAKHVNSAIKLFGHAEESKKKALAQRIKKAAKAYNITIPETTQCYKYLNEASTEQDTIDIPAEVENIIFDMGDVLVYGTIEETLEECSLIPDRVKYEIYHIIMDELFSRKRNKEVCWYDINKAKEYYIKIASDEAKEYCDEAFDLLLPALQKFEYTDALIDLFKSRGFKVYYLSNWDYYSYQVQKHVFDLLTQRFDGGIFSFECHIEKPSLSIYRLLTDRYGLEPDKCLFFDDKKENIDACKTCGWHGIMFDSKTTPNKIFKTLYRPSMKITDDKKLIPVVYDGALQYVGCMMIKHWYVTDKQNPDYIAAAAYREYLAEAIENDKRDEDTDSSVSKYVFVPAYNYEAICVGIINIDPDGEWSWEIQYPINITDSKEISDMPIQHVDEWSMAACNPIVGIAKPYILKVHDDRGSLINADTYALSPDIISDKYLVINENANLEIIDASKLDNMIVEEYEFIGDKRSLKKIAEAYRTNKVVDNTFFYTALTGKPMLTEDQIDFDSDFKKVDFAAIKETEFSIAASMHEAFENTMTDVNVSFEVDHVASDPNISIREDVNGFYVQDNLTKNRSESVPDIESITEQMIDSLHNFIL